LEGGAVGCFAAVIFSLLPASGQPRQTASAPARVASDRSRPRRKPRLAPPFAPPPPRHTADVCSRLHGENEGPRQEYFIPSSVSLKGTRSDRPVPEVSAQALDQWAGEKAVTQREHVEMACEGREVARVERFARSEAVQQNLMVPISKDLG
jgi:hypothetical protein